MLSAYLQRDNVENGYKAYATHDMMLDDICQVIDENLDIVYIVENIENTTAY